MDLSDLIGSIPHRMAFAGGWIDQPFMSKLNPDPPGSMVVVAIEPSFPCMERSGMAGGTRRIATELWNGKLPADNPADLVRELYEKENEGKDEPSGSQDMIGLIYPGINRLDYDFNHEGGIFPCHIESNRDPEVARWLEHVIHMLPIAPRPEGYNPLGVRNLSPEWAQRLGQSGKDCYDAIINKDINALGTSMNECMLCWETMLPDILHHHTLTRDLKSILGNYQSRFAGAMYSGCGGGYIYIVSDEPVPGTFKINIRT